MMFVAGSTYTFFIQTAEKIAVKDVFDPTRTLHEENYCMVELVRQIGSVGRETRDLQETVRYF